MNYITSACRIKNWKVLLNGAECFSRNTTIGDFFEAAYKDLGIDYPKFYKMDMLSKAGFIASEYLLRQRSLSGYKSDEVAIVLSNRNASLDTDIKYAESAKLQASPALFVYTLPNIVIGEISIRNKFKGENSFFVAPSFDAKLLFDYVGITLETTSSRACIAGWVDVLGEEHDVLLYLVEKKNDGLAMEHSVPGIEELYS